MASGKQIRDEIMKLTIAVNSDPAQKEIHSLREANNKLNESIDVLKQKKDELGRRNKANAQEWDALTKEIQKSTSEIGINKKKIEELRSSMDITQMTVGQLKKELTLLNQMKVNVLPGSDAAKKLNDQIGAINTRLREVNGGAIESRRSFSSLADSFNHYSGIITAGAAALVGFGITVQNIIDRSNKMADAMTGVEKKAQMTKAEVEELTKSFADFDTRTSKIDLVKIAEVGGSLGVAKEDLLDFTREVDKAYVALGDSWKGSVEDLANQLGKITNGFSETKNIPVADAINMVGSALNELAANGTATEQNVADFTRRVSALPEALRPAIHEVLGLGAAFEENNIDAERSATALASFLTSAGKNAQLFANVMKLPVEKVKELINNSPAEFFLQFTEGLKGIDATQLASTLDYLKLNDTYVQSIVGAAANNTQDFRDAISLANQAIVEGTSLQNEFNKVNNNAAGIWEKLQKKIAETVTSQALFKFLEGAINTFGKFLGVVEDSEGTVTDFRNTLLLMTKIILIAATTTISYNAALMLSNATLTGAKAQLLGYTVVQQVNNALNKVGIVLQTSWNLLIGLGGVALGRLSGSTALQTAAQQQLNLAMKANPFGAILAVITLLISAYIAFGREVDDVTAKQRILNEVKSTAQQKMVSEKAEIMDLVSIARSEAATNEQRALALKKLNDLIPDHIGLLTAQNIKTAEGVGIINKYIDALNRQAYAEAVKEKRNELIKKQIDIQSKDVDKGWMDAGGVGSYLEQKLNKGNLKREMSSQEATRIDNMVNVVEVEKELAKYVPIVATAYRKRRDELRANFKELSSLNGVQKKLIKTDPNAILGSETKKEDPFTPPTDRTSTSNKSTNTKSSSTDETKNREADKWKAILDQRKTDAETAKQLARQIELDIEDAKIEAMNEGFEKELATLEIQHQRKLAQIDKQKIQQSAFDKIDEQIAKATGKDKEFFETLKKSWKDNNDQLEKEKEAQRKVFDLKRNALKAKSDQEFLAKEDYSHQREISKLKKQHNEELATYTTLDQLKEGLRGKMDEKDRLKIKTWAEGKEALSKHYQKRELEMQLAHIEAMVKLYEGLDLGILTPQQREQVMKFIDEAGDKIAEFKAKIKSTEQVDAKEPKKLNKKGSTDVLGMSLEDWDTMFTNFQNGTDMIGNMIAAVGALQNAFSTYYQYVDANEKRQLQQYEKATVSKKSSLKRQLNEGYINQETYKRLTLQADEELEKKKAEIALKQAKREKQMAIVSTLMNTAQAIMGIWAQFPKFDFGATAAIMTGVVGAMGALQVATIMSQPLPSAIGYEEGYNTDYPITRQQDGKRFNVRRRGLRSGLVDRPTHFIAGENGLEMVIDSPTWTTYSPELKSAIYAANAKAKGYEGGFNTVPEKSQTSENNDEMMMKIMTALNQNTAVMRDIKENGLAAYFVKSARNGKEVQDMLDENQKLINKNKH